MVTRPDSQDARLPPLPPHRAADLMLYAIDRGRRLDFDDPVEAYPLWHKETMLILGRAFGREAPEAYAFSWNSMEFEKPRDRQEREPERMERYRRYMRKQLKLLESFERVLRAFADEPPAQTHAPGERTRRTFVGHGRSGVWRDLAEFLKGRLQLDVEEFNRVAVAGTTTIERLQEMLNAANFAFLIMTAEDETAEGKLHARQNVIHEVGLFQGRLGFRRAIVLLEEGCEEFSNITGLSQIRFPKGSIKTVFEDIRRVLEREGLIPGGGTAF